MRKLKLQMQLSLDGFVAGPNGEMDWMTWNWDEELNSFVTEIMASVDHLLLGRKLAEGFIPHWEAAAINPENTDAGAQQMAGIPKLVFTQTLNSHNWPNTELMQGYLAEQINQLKQQPGGDLMAYGGAGFASALISHNLVDCYYLFINPAAIGNGLRIFGELQQTLKLTLVKATTFECGVIVLHYKPAITA